jgi:MFS family permease
MGMVAREICTSRKDRTLSKGEELKRNWLLLLTALLGGAMLPMPIYSVSLFMESWGREFGWSRPEMGLANSSFTIAMVVAAPLTGRLIDRFGSRAPAMISLLLLAGMFAATTLVSEQIWTLYAAYALLAFAGAGTSPIAFTKTVCAYFERARGLALGITVTGTALASLLTPIVVAATIEDHGWRGSWIAFSLMSLALFPLLFFGLKDPARPAPAAYGEDESPAPPLAGRSLSEAARTRGFWLMGAGFFLTSTAILAAIAHMTPILRGSGLSTEAAILLQSLMGIGLIFGRLLCGYIVDRVFAPLVFQIICAMGAGGFLLLALQGGAVTSAVGVMLVGAAMGAEYDLVAYLVSRYFGMAHYGRIYGWQYAFTMLGGVAGPFIIGGLYAGTGDYLAYLLLASGMLVIAALLLRGLGPYPRRLEAS